MTSQAGKNNGKWRVMLAPDGHNLAAISTPREFLLAGSAPFCDIVLPQAPWLAAFVYLGGEAVEVWPLVPEAAEMWGCPVVGRTLNLFGASLRVERTGTKGTTPARMVEIDEVKVARWPILRIGAGGKSQSVLVNQPITTLGAGFPSKLRLPKTALDPCQLVMKWEKEELNLVILPKREKGTFREVQLTAGAEVTFNGVSIRFLGLRDAANIEGAAAALQSIATPTVVFEEKYRVHYTKIKDIFSSRRSRFNRQRWLWMGAVGGIVSAAAAVCGYYLYVKLSPFL